MARAFQGRISCNAPRRSAYSWKKKRGESTGCRKRRKVETDDDLYARVFERETSGEEEDNADPSVPSNVIIHANVDADGILEDSDCEEGDEYVAFIPLGKAVF